MQPQPPAALQGEPGALQAPGCPLPLRATQAVERGLFVWGFTARGLPRCVDMGKKKKKTRREREVRFNKAQHADRSLPGCKKTGKPSQAAGYLPFLADETARGDHITAPAELSAVFVHPTDWEGGRTPGPPPVAQDPNPWAG